MMTGWSSLLLMMVWNLRERGIAKMIRDCDGCVDQGGILQRNNSRLSTEQLVLTQHDMF